MFKNAIAYLVTPGFRINPEILERVPALPCGPNQGRTAGFTCPCLHSTAGFVHAVGQHALICMETEERLLPGSVIADEVADRAAALEQTQGYKPGRKQLRELKERVIVELLPKAFTQKKRTYAVFSGPFFIIDTSSPARADLFLDVLCRAFDDGLPLSLIKTKEAITGQMVKWLLGDSPISMSIDDYAELEKEEPGKPAITYKHTELDDTDMQRRIAAGYVPRKLGMTFSERLSFKLDDAMNLKQLTALDVLKSEKFEQKTAEDDFDADFVLMVGELVSAYSNLIVELGGLEEPEPDLLTESNASELDSDDPLYLDAVKVVLENGKASISLVQRHLQIGYNRAARLIESMEEAGVVSTMDSSGSRRVLAENQERKAA
jgi:recombination associated protein RdgC